MDTQINLKDDNFIYLNLKKYYLNNGKMILSTTNNNRYDLKNYKDKFLGNEVFVFNEYDIVELEFFSENLQDELRIECYCEEGEENEGIKKLKSGEKAFISTGGDRDSMLVPGRYDVSLIRGNDKYYGFYFIKSSNTTWDSLIYMRNYIENYVRGLSYDIYSQRNNKSNYIPNVDEIFINKYVYLDKKKYVLISSLDSIIKNPITSIEKAYSYAHKSKRATNKSQRWINKKGYKFNQNIYQPDIFYEKKSIECKNINENKFLKNIIQEIYNIILKLLNEFKIECECVNKRINQYKARAEKSIVRKQNANREKYISKRTMNSIDGDLNISKNELDKCNLELKQIKEYIDNISKIKNSLSFYLNESWLLNIENDLNYIVPSKIIKNKYYNQVYEIYKYLSSCNEDGQNKVSFPHKKTSKLFEIYNFLLIKDIFEDMGFIWTDGWIKEKSTILYFNGDLKSEDYIVLEYKNYKIKIVYDKIIQRSKDLTSQRNTESQISAKQNLKNIRPDIIIEFYKEDDFLEAIIVEVKYRKLKYIHNDVENTEVDEQLESYRELEYYDSNLKAIRSRMMPIAKVIAIYPEQKGSHKIVNSTYSNILFLPIMIGKEDEEYIHYGYENLKNEILEVIRPYMKEELATGYKNVSDLLKKIYR